MYCAKSPRPKVGGVYSSKFCFDFWWFGGFFQHPHISMSSSLYIQLALKTPMFNASMCALLVGDKIPFKPLFIDIETSGLDSSSDFVSMIGFFSPDFGIRQFGGPEALLLQEAREFVLEHQDLVLVSYNGDFFDLPFLKARCAKNSIPEFLYGLKHIDLFPKSCERLASSGGRISKDGAIRKMGLYIPNTIDGHYCALLAKQGSSVELISVFEHNAVDLTATAKLFFEYVRFSWLPGIKFEGGVLFFG